MTFPAPHLVPLGVCLAVGSVWDVTKRRIPNAVSGAAALSGVVVQAVDRGGLAALSGVAAAVVTILLLYRPWTAGGIGGGDLKLAAAAATWMGLGGMIRYGLAVAATGGVVSVTAYLLSRRAARQEMRANLTLAALQQTLPPVPTQSAGRVSVPYGLAIAAGAAISLLTT
jgi:prepilin peptidase CpaA